MPVRRDFFLVLLVVVFVSGADDDIALRFGCERYPGHPNRRYRLQQQGEGCNDDTYPLPCLSHLAVGCLASGDAIIARKTAARRYFRALLTAFIRGIGPSN